MRGEFVDLAGARLYYYAAGTRGAGNPVVFIHGFPTSGHLWSDVVPLMPPGHRLVVLDLLGYGRSDRPLERTVDARAQGDRVVALMDELRIERACLVGHGFGGGVAQSIAARQPERISHLCLVDSIAFDRWPIRRLRAARALLPLAGVTPPSAIVSMLRREADRGYGDPVRAARSLDLYVRPFCGADGVRALVETLRGIATADPDLAASVASIRAPTSVVWGRRDRVLPLDAARALAGRIPGAMLEIIDEGHHFTPEETPREVADAAARLLAR